MGWTAPFTAVTGNTFTAAQWNTHARDNLNHLLWQRNLSVADQSKTSDTALADATNLGFAVLANEEWHAEWTLFYTGTLGDLKLAITVPASATGIWGVHGLVDSAIASAADLQAGAVNAFGDANTKLLGDGNNSATYVMAVVRATVFVAGTAGTVQLRFAQQTSSATATTLRAGSCVIAHRLSQ